VITLSHVRAALTLTAFDVDAAHARMAPVARRMLPQAGRQPRLAAVLVLLYPDSDGLRLLLTRRPDSLREHSGQISFPGGSRDANDDSFVATALREACEELGLCAQAVDVLGQLSTLYIPPSNFEVHPIVGCTLGIPTLQPNREEVAEVLHVPLDWLLDDARKGSERWPLAGQIIDVPYYLLHGHKVWGATAIMLSELEGRLRSVSVSNHKPAGY
jgi:8-oxo-dGTP pyrophosphatase MutT (NUDIX family)